MNREEAKTQLIQTLSQYLREPMVSLRISKFRIGVAGDVKNPGSYETTAGETVMDAILRAGGANRVGVVPPAHRHGIGSW